MRHGHRDDAPQQSAHSRTRLARTYKQVPDMTALSPSDASATYRTTRCGHPLGSGRDPHPGGKNGSVETRSNTARATLPVRIFGLTNIWLEG
jgi:hypothetical protein